jgi:hypothetical protein
MSGYLFDLRPALYRLRDGAIAQAQTLLTPAEQADLAALQAQTGSFSAEQQAQLDQLTAKAARGPLASMLAVVEEQLDLISENLDQLYDNQFIETCADWVIPYIGDLIGYQSIAGVPESVDSPRAAVANTISFRRRKGTVLVLEQFARDLTGWGAHAVEFFEVTAVTQYVKHVRPSSTYAPSMRDWQSGLYMNSGFDQVAHRPDVRRIETGLGRYNLQNIGIFLWSLTAYSLTDTPCRPVPGAAGCYRFNPLGRDTPLFNNPVSQGANITQPAARVNVPAALARRELCSDLQSGAGSSYYGEGLSLALYISGTLLNAYQIHVCNLSGADGAWINLPTTGVFWAAIDPALGRIALSPQAAAASAAAEAVAPGTGLTASFYTGFNGDSGGGEYARTASFTVQNEAWVLPFPDTVKPARYTTLQGALAEAVQLLNLNGQVAVEITTSLTFEAAVAIDVPAGGAIELRAADGHRPVVMLASEMEVTGGAESAFLINGLVLSAAAAPASAKAALVHAPAARPGGGASQLGQLTLTHCTLVPGWALAPAGTPLYPGQPALSAEAPGLTVSAARSIVGPLRIASLTSATLTDSIIDANAATSAAYAAEGVAGAPAGGGALTATGCTFIGKIHAVLLELVSDCLILAALAPGDADRAPMWADRRQAGCVRFSYLPAAAITPQQFECVTPGPQTPQPLFVSLRYGDPGYAKLMACTDDSIRRGADDGGEMGAFHFVLAPLRETDLGIRLAEYVPAGLEYGIIYQN